MKYVRLRVDLPPAAVTPVHEALMTREDVHAVHLLFGGVRADDPAYVYYVEGDRAALETELAAADVDAYEVTAVDDDHVVVHLQTDPTPIERGLRETFTGGSLVPTLPVVFEADGSLVTTVVGATDDVRAAVESAPVDLEVESVGEYAGPATGRSLTTRQRDVLETARELGYYDVPRTASQEDVADALGVSAATVAEHLRKAEARLVDDALE